VRMTPKQIVGVGLMLACACSSRVEGRLHSTAEATGSLDLNLARCASGEPHGFFGVVLIADNESGTQLKAIKDVGHGDVVVLGIPGTCNADGNCKALRITPEQCSTFALQVERSNTRINHVWSLRGSLDLKCTVDEGEVKAHVVFSRCA